MDFSASIFVPGVNRFIDYSRNGLIERHGFELRFNDLPQIAERTLIGLRLNQTFEVLINEYLSIVRQKTIPKMGFLVSIL